MSRALKSWLKHRVGTRGVRVARGLGRIRWFAKIGAVRTAQARFRDQPVAILKYVLLDPEFDNFTYEIENGDELVAKLAVILERPAEELAGYLREATTDPGLTTELRRHLRWRLDLKRRLPLGFRYSWYVIARALKPELIVEAGVMGGLSSLAMIRALAHNRADGHPGRLLSVDLLNTAGWLVPKQQRADWTLKVGSADEVLKRELPGHRVGMFIEDMTTAEDVVRRTLAAVLNHAADGAMLVTSNDRGVLEAVCRERGIPYAEHRDRARNHFYQGTTVCFAGPLCKPGDRVAPPTKPQESASE